MRAQIPIVRVGTVEEPATVITFLCKQEAGYITGQILSVTVAPDLAVGLGLHRLSTIPSSCGLLRPP
jgi:hypothetical protein